MKSLFITLNKDKNIVTFPNGTYDDWSMYGKNVEDAIDFYNDINGYGCWCMLIGGAAVLVGVAAGVITTAIVKAKKKKNQEETEEEKGS